MAITIKKNILTNNDCYKAGRTITPNSMQLHTIGTAQNSASALASYWNQGGVEACVHYCVDAEHEGLVYQFLPDNRHSWADGGYGNSNSITVELMESDYMRYTGGSNYTITNESNFKADVTRAYNTAVQFFASKCKEYGWNPQEKMSNGLHRVYSHDEGRRLGLSTSHVDPTHIWNRYGWTMDQFRADVAKAMGGATVLQPTPTAAPSVIYRVRKSWADEKSQIFAGTLEGAKKIVNQNSGYKVYDENGKQVYPATTIITQGTKPTAYASGIPKSKDEYIKNVAEIAVSLYKETKILPSVVAAQCCLETGYGLGADSTELVKRNNLLGMKTDLINNTWKDHTVWNGESFVKRTPEYYNGVLTYINDSFRVYTDYENCIRDYEMFLLYVENGKGYKYRRIQGMTDPAKVINAIRIGTGTNASPEGYCTDPSYEIKILRIIDENNLTKYDEVTGVKNVTTTTTVAQPNTTDKYHVGSAIVNGVVQDRKGAFSVLANAIKLATTTEMNVYDVTTGKKVFPSQTAPTTSVKYYRVAESFKDGKYIGQKGAYTSKENALKAAKEMNLKCFDPDGKQIYPNPAPVVTKSISEKAVEIGLALAADNKHGYNNNKDKRGGNPDYACSSFVADCYIKAGVDLGTTCDKVYTKDMKKIFTAHGFEDVGKTVNMKTGKGAKVGDVFVRPQVHTELYIGDGKFVGARGNYDGKAGDSSGGEISVTNFWNDGWTQVLRYTAEPKEYRVQAGSFLLKDNANKMLANVKNANLPGMIVEVNNEYVVQLGLFSVKQNAENLVKKAADAGIVTLIVEV